MALHRAELRVGPTQGHQGDSQEVMLYSLPSATYPAPIHAV